VTTTVSKWMQQHERTDEPIMNELHTLDFSFIHFFLAPSRARTLV
jgi:hypothetical protein